MLAHRAKIPIWRPTRLPARRPPAPRGAIQRRCSSSSSEKGKTTLASIQTGPQEVAQSKTRVSYTFADQAFTAVSGLGKFVKVSIYAALATGTVIAASYVGMHLWLEYVELPPGKLGRRPGEDEPYAWAEEAEGWSGGYLGKGTDPRLGLRARILIRGAWHAQHRQSGQSASVIASSAAGSQAASTVDPATGQRVIQLIDSGFALAIDHLKHALQLIETKGKLRLDKQAPPDRALVEIEERLAELRERIGTREMLIEAKKGYERIWDSCVAQAEREGGVDRSWAGREAMRIAKKLGDVGSRISLFHKAGSKAAREEERQAHAYLVWAATSGLGVAVGDGDVLRRAPQTPRVGEPTSEPVAPVPRRTGGFFSWGRRSNPEPAAIPVAPSPAKQLGPEDALVLDSVRALSVSSTDSDEAPLALSLLPPALARYTITAILSLSTLLVNSDLANAHSLQASTLSLLETLPPPSSSTPSAILHHEWLKVREALAAIYSAEVGRAAGLIDSGDAVALCRKALSTCEASITRLSSDALLNDAAFKPKSQFGESGSLAKAEVGVERDARLTGTMAANLAGLIHEASCPSLSALPSSLAVPTWCGREGGDVTAAEFYKTAMKLSSGLGGKGGPAERSRQEGGEEGMEGEGEAWRESWENFVRVREKSIGTDKRKRLV